jgi:hypothetical protein
MPRLVLSIDPGRAKHGVAIIEADAMRVVYRCVIEATSLTGTVNGLLTRFPSIAVIVMGDGTGSKAAVDLVRQVSGSTPMAVVNEVGTSERARARYCADHPATGWRRLLPMGLRHPDAPYDDYAAIVLAEDYLSGLNARENPRK